MEMGVRRSWLVEAIILLIFGIIFIRLTFLHLYPEDWLLSEIEEKRSLEYRIQPTRGEILDRNGEIIATDHVAYHIAIDPQFIALHGEPEVVERVLSKALRMDPQTIREKLAETHRRYIRIKKYVPASDVKGFKSMRSGVVYQPDEHQEAERLKGVLLEEVPIRSYPKGSLMAHVIGFSNKEGVGSAGIELQYDSYLKGKEGHRISKKDARKREIYSERKVDIPPEDGASVILTLDQQLQYHVERVIEAMCRESEAEAGWAIVQDIPTGEILAMVSFPTYDPNRFNRAPKEWMRNRTIGVNYEPGSTIKSALIGVALDEGLVKPNDKIDCEKGRWRYGGRTLHDSKPHDVLSVADILKVSSNIGTAKIALQFEPELLYERLSAFQFGKRLGIELPAEERGTLHPPATWSKISPTRIGIGHEMNATALQVLSMMSTIAYNGVQMRPHLIKEIVDHNGEILYQAQPESIGMPLGASTARMMQRLLERVVSAEGGTGKKAALEGYRVAGKTGTAQKIRPVEEGGGYYKKRFTSSFVGFLPVENPRLSIIVVADDPGIYTDNGVKIKYGGGSVCAPAFQKIAEYAVRYLRIPPEGRRVYMTRDEE